MVEVKVEKQMWINEIYDNPLSLTKYKMDEACQNFPSQNLESKIKNSRHEELETMSLDSVTEKELPMSEVEQEGHQFQTGDYFKLRKAVEGIASPKEAALFSTTLSPLKPRP
ncbi:hypothetical protein V6N13_053319 [Hibiscus sabdariffa]